tara:strand:+ start:35 stop:865 length:831 start_codon:yes stop_codon:yes gene_type:complete
MNSNQSFNNPNPESESEPEPEPERVNEPEPECVNEPEQSIPIIEIDCGNLRKDRQENNNNIIKSLLLKENISETELKGYCNDKELDRLLNEIINVEPDFTFEKFIKKCLEDKIFCTTVAGRISINASRQGGTDEKYIVDKCNETTSKYGVNINNMDNSSLRPLKGSPILVSKKDLKEKKYSKDDCLKSFDYIISGRKEGYVFAKVCYGSGGGQDGVFIESNYFGEWASEYGEDGKYYCILIDTDQADKFNNLKNKFINDNKVFVVDHKDLQRLLIQ